LNTVVLIFSEKLEVGNWLATWHGFKFTVRKLIPMRGMVKLQDASTGELFTPNLLIAMKNLPRGLEGFVAPHLCNSLIPALSLSVTLKSFQSALSPD
jgi:hypothetical protein